MKSFRSNCPLTRSLDLLGDKWSLLILRDINNFGKTTFKELAQMEEKIATNTLADRLEKLTTEGLITKTRSQQNKLVFHYNMTTKGLDIFPAVRGLVDWSAKYLYQNEEVKDLALLLLKTKLH